MSTTCWYNPQGLQPWRPVSLESAGGNEQQDQQEEDSPKANPKEEGRPSTFERRLQEASWSDERVDAGGSKGPWVSGGPRPVRICRFVVVFLFRHGSSHFSLDEFREDRELVWSVGCSVVGHAPSAPRVGSVGGPAAFCLDMAAFRPATGRKRRSSPDRGAVYVVVCGLLRVALLWGCVERLPGRRRHRGGHRGMVVGAHRCGGCVCGGGDRSVGHVHGGVRY